MGALIKVRKDGHNTGKLCFAGVRVARAAQHPSFTIIHLFLARGPRASEKRCPQDFISSHTVGGTPNTSRGSFASEARGGHPGRPQAEEVTSHYLEADVPRGRGGPSRTARSLLAATATAWDTSHGLTCSHHSGGSTTSGRWFFSSPLAQ